MSQLRTTDQASPDADERGVRVVLPRRPNRKPASIVFGLLAVVFLGFSLVALGGAWFGVASRGEGLRAALGSSLSTLPFLIAGVGLSIAAFAAWSSRCTVELTPEELRVVEHVGQLRWTRHQAARALRSIEVREHLESRGTQGGKRWQLEARFESAPPFAFARGYPKSELEELAEHLREAALDWGEEVAERAPSLLRETGSTLAAGRDVDAPGDADLPAGSEIQVHPTAGGIVCVVPPMGVRRGSHGLFLMGLAFMIFVSVIGAFILLAEAGDGDWGDLLLGALVCGTFFGVGAALMAYGWNLGRRSARLTVDEDGLLVERLGPFGDKVQRFAREAIEDVRAGPSGLSVNDVPVLEVQVIVRGEKALGLLSQRSGDECRALAQRLRDALRS